MKSFYTKKVKPEDIEYGKRLVEDFKVWVGPDGDGYGIKVKDVM